MLETQNLPSEAYMLVNTITGEIVSPRVILTSSEAYTLNYAYALNGSPLKYI